MKWAENIFIIFYPLPYYILSYQFDSVFMRSETWCNQWILLLNFLSEVFIFWEILPKVQISRITDIFKINIKSLHSRNPKAETYSGYTSEHFQHFNVWFFDRFLKKLTKGSTRIILYLPVGTIIKRTLIVD